MSLAPNQQIENALHFRFADMERDIICMQKIAKDFIEEQSFYNVINPWLNTLKYFKTNSYGTELNWEISIANPIRTKKCLGTYMPGGKGKHTVVGTVSAIWQIQIADNKVLKKGKEREYFAVTGKASTRVCILEYAQEGTPRELARWKFDIGNTDSPGCHFHTQILGEDDDCQFPKSLDVPRLPTILVTPMDALEFLLAELFQEEWAREVATQSADLGMWSRAQKNRLIRLLDWQKSKISEAAGSPWTYLKGRKPHAHLLTDGVLT